MSRAEVDEKLVYSRPASLPGAEIFSAERSPRRWRVFHQGYDACICLNGPRGGTAWSYRSKSQTALVGMVMLMEAGETHVNGPVTAPQDFKVVSMSLDRFESVARSLGLRTTPHFKVPQLENAELFAALSGLHDCLDRCETPLEQQTRLARCLQLLLEYCGETEPTIAPAAKESRAVERAKEHLHGRFAEKVTLDELATVSGIGTFQLLRSFEKKFGLPPHAYQLQLRVAKARVFLARGMSAAAAAGELGFADQSHFGRHFKRITGVPPGEYARSGHRSRFSSARTF